MKHRMTDEPFNIFGDWSIHGRPLWENAVCAITENLDLCGALSCKGYTQKRLRAVRLGSEKGFCFNVRKPASHRLDGGYGRADIA